MVKPKKKPIMVLTTTNPFEQPLKYQVIAASADGKGMTAAMVCPIAKHATRQRTFKGLIVQITIDNIALVGPDDDQNASCK